jgi:4'-phosphopantetheinyl transferase EntD
MRSAGTSGSIRRTVAAMSGSSARPANGRSCLGLWRRDAGQNRVPEPPARITAWKWRMVALLPRHGGSGRGTMRAPLVVEVAFDRELAHGRCVGLRIPGGALEVDALAEASLVAEERAFAATLRGLRRRFWIGGRAALREALARAGIAVAAPVLSDDRGAPLLPEGVVASITHKERLAAALVARAASARIGVDLEADVRGKQDIASRVLTENELAELAHLEAEERAREVLLRFSAKEAIYKALDPFVRRYVGFQEVSVQPRADGSARVEARLREGEGPYEVEVGWSRFDGVVLTTARVSRVLVQTGRPER